ncbi:hypothetical protein C943_03848 [Mariniradius saccharolyticus AK6]|uniref:Uncharacterized protein n=1 Tax=Mariniradius saccharolyticus AK6 TaxID=1239962 RepID=M7XZU7_9BACT|nr:hypothetical protein C943_03848 [Mariniradius saccharolyticus AK6]
MSQQDKDRVSVLIFENTVSWDFGLIVEKYSLHWNSDT